MHCNVNESLTEMGCIPNDPIGFVTKFYAIGISIIGGVAVLFIIIGGYLILTSQGNPSQLQKGRNYIVYAVIELVLAAFGYVLVHVLTVNVLHIPGFS